MSGDRFHFAVVILGAGASSRMGRPKLLLPWRQTTVIGHAIDHWRRLAAAEVAVVMRPDDSLLAQELDRHDVFSGSRILNPNPERGMFSSILCASRWVASKSDLTHVVLALGDQPQVHHQTHAQLLAFASRNPSRICQPSLAGRPKHPVVFPFQIFQSIHEGTDEDLKQFLARNEARRAFCPTEDEDLGHDLDTPEDYARWVAVQH